MPVLSPDRSVFLIIDVQEKLAPAIDGGAVMINTIKKLAAAADILGIPVLATEQYPKGLGPTVAELAGRPTILKDSFDATAAEGFFEALPTDHPDILLAGCEAHVCVLQTAMGLRRAGRRTILITDAVGSRKASDKAAALARAAEEGVERVTAEMALFEWLQDRRHPRFREILALIR
jgi:nicotinamidase-related amidase